MVEVDDETIEALKSYVALVELCVRTAPDEPVAKIWDCGCRGPLPECRCMKRHRLVKAFIGAEPILGVAHIHRYSA